ncbi:unnamed protein product [Closterium sp. NIES-64]|nr:unnamed protein product [Closterium sp. NIES-64]
MVNAPHVAHPSNSPPRTAPSSSASPSPTPSAPELPPHAPCPPPPLPLVFLTPAASGCARMHTRRGGRGRGRMRHARVSRRERRSGGRVAREGNGDETSAEGVGCGAEALLKMSIEQVRASALYRTRT